MEESDNSIMYGCKSRTYPIIGCIYYVILGAAVCIGTYLYYFYNASAVLIAAIQPVMACIAVVISYLLERKSALSGITKENWKIDCIISLIIFAIGITIKVFTSEAGLFKILSYAVYTFFIQCLSEEIEFRGFLQSCLFGLKWNRFILYAIGAILFSAVHIPALLFNTGNVSLPQLAGTFACHYIFCLIAAKRQNIYIPVALHFIANFVL